MLYVVIFEYEKKIGRWFDDEDMYYTLDPEFIESVWWSFKELYNKGLIYKGKFPVNWCPRCNSTLADDEVEHKEQKTQLYTFKYDKDFPIEIATILSIFGYDAESVYSEKLVGKPDEIISKVCKKHLLF